MHSAYPTRNAYPCPRFSRSTKVTAPDSRATLSVASLPPSTITNVVTGRPHASSGIAANTAPMLASSSYAHTSPTTGSNVTPGYAASKSARDS